MRDWGLKSSQLNLLVNVALASFLIQGSVAYLSYAWLLLMVPLGVVGMGMATAAFPTLAEQSAQDQPDEQRQTFRFERFLILSSLQLLVGCLSQFDNLDFVTTGRRIFSFT